MRSLEDLRTRINHRAHFTALIQLLLNAGADVEARYGRYEITALEMAVEALSEGLPEAIFDAVLQAAAERNGPVPSEEVGETIAGMEFVWIPAGEFRMGSNSPEAEDWERPVTRVRISRGFWLGRYEVTQDQWQGVMGINPSESSRCERCPVEQVSWDDAQEFIGRLNAQDGGNRYRLPTEAEWEYAARAGTQGERDLANLDAVAWRDANSNYGPHPVGQKAPNAWGLHDMLGNVSEWVQDWYGDYPGGSVTDPAGPGSGTKRVYRGGDWSFSAMRSRASHRNVGRPGRRSSDLGLRLLRIGE